MHGIIAILSSDDVIVTNVASKTKQRKLCRACVTVCDVSAADKGAGARERGTDGCSPEAGTGKFGRVSKSEKVLVKTDRWPQVYLQRWRHSFWDRRMWDSSRGSENENLSILKLLS